MLKKEIGGFFEFELSKKVEYHKNALRLNSGRACLDYILKVKKYKKIYMPIYICDDLIKLVKSNNIEYEFYFIGNNFFPIFNKKLKNDECFLYVNYYGLQQRHLKVLKFTFPNLIIDNTQAFFSLPLNGVYSFYSARKFFGVADGGYLYINSDEKLPITKDLSYDKYNCLLKRIDVSAESSYKEHQENESKFSYQPIKEMSNLTLRILLSINYQEVISIRNRNFCYLDLKLKDYNMINFKEFSLNGPLCYPLLLEADGLREHLLSNKIYVPTYWKEILEKVPPNTFEYKLTKWLIPIPIDQRYDIDDMDYIVNEINKYLKR